MPSRLWMRILATIAAAAVIATIANAVRSNGRSDESIRVMSGAELSAPLEVTPAAPAVALPSPLTDPGSASPYGPLGSLTNPLGSPRRSLAACDAEPTTAAGIVSISVDNGGFPQDCYRVAAGASTLVQLADSATNPSTGLTIPVVLALSLVSKPVVTQVAGSGDNKPMPGLTVPSDPVPYVDMRNALFTSPTAPDRNPITFSLPPLELGQYLLQVPTLPLVPAAVVTVSAIGSAPPPSAAPPSTTSTTIASTANVTVKQVTPGDRQALEVAFALWERLPATCPGSIVPGTERLARVGGVEWAMARFGPAANCTHTLAPAVPGGPTRSVDPMQVGPFARTSGLPIAVFERQPDGRWLMNQEGGSPFPCPAPGGTAPGPGNGALPAAALAAWGLSYATNCAFPSYPTQPRA